MIDEVVVGLRPHEAIAEARFADADLALVTLRAGHADHGHVNLLHCDGAGAGLVLAGWWQLNGEMRTRNKQTNTLNMR